MPREAFRHGGGVQQLALHAGKARSEPPLAPAHGGPARLFVEEAKTGNGVRRRVQATFGVRFPCECVAIKTSARVPRADRQIPMADRALGFCHPFAWRPCDVPEPGRFRQIEPRVTERKELLSALFYISCRLCICTVLYYTNNRYP